MPTSIRPGNSSASVAASIAVNAAFRTAAGRMPMPTRMRSVIASAAAACATPPRKKQSSTTQSSSNPNASARCA